MVIGVFTAWSGFYGGTIGNMLDQWAQIGVFTYVLPFLIIFALIFAILNQIKLFNKNRGVNAIIALAVGFMSLQFDFVPRFFSEIFPRLGIGLGIILIILIMIGMFMDPEKSGLMIALMIIGFIIVIVILLNTAGSLGWMTGYWWEENWGTILGIVVVLGLIGMIIFSTEKKDTNKSPINWKALGFSK